MDDLMEDDQRAVWTAMTSVYEYFLAGDSATVDTLMHPDVTIWDSAQPDLARGLAQLQALRTRRPTDESAPKVVGIEATDPVIDVWGDIALVRHLLRVRFSLGADEIVRNSSVWRRVEGRWLAVHNHEDVLAG
jgi:ketosteroid isomerase-like protein